MVTLGTIVVNSALFMFHRGTRRSNVWQHQPASSARWGFAEHDKPKIRVPLKPPKNHHHELHHGTAPLDHWSTIVWAHQWGSVRYQQRGQWHMIGLHAIDNRKWCQMALNSLMMYCVCDDQGGTLCENCAVYSIGILTHDLWLPVIQIIVFAGVLPGCSPLWALSGQ